MVTKVEKIKKHSGRGRPVLLNDLLKQSIILYKSTNPDWSAERILNSIKINHYNKLKKAHPDWPDTKIREQTAFPGVNRVQRYLKEISPSLNQKSPLQEKWNLGTLNDYPITPEAVKKIFELKARGKNYISIRIARWISRLSVLPLPIEVLYLTAMEYSTAEEIAEISGTELNTATMDLILQEHMTDRDVPGNGSKKSAAVPVKNDIPPVKIEDIPVVNDTPVSKADTTPVKNEIEAGKVKSPLPKARVTLVKRDVPPEKTNIPPQEEKNAPVEKVTPPEKKEDTPAKADTVPDKTDTAPEKNKISGPEAESHDRKPKVEKSAAEEKPRDSLKKYHLPNMHERQASINEFLKFVQKQKDKEL